MKERADIERDMHEIMDEIDNLLRKYKVPTAKRMEICSHVVSGFANGMHLGDVDEDTRMEWVGKFQGYGVGG